MNSFPDIYYDGKYDNPTVFSPNSSYAILYAQDRDSLNGDADSFKKFIDNAMMRFRRSRTYKSYKSYLMNLGLDRCQMISGIVHEEMATIEMHHNGLTLFDVCIIIMNHILAVKGHITTYDLVLELKKVHTNNMVPLVMLSRTCHQLAHNSEEFFVPASMCFGYWTELLDQYKYGITYGLARKIAMFIQMSLNHENDPDLNQQYLTLNNTILSWAQYNEYGYINSLNNQ